MRKYDYYYGSQADQFSFVRIPKILLTGKDFQKLSLKAAAELGMSRSKLFYDSDRIIDRLLFQMKER